MRARFLVSTTVLGAVAAGMVLMPAVAYAQSSGDELTSAQVAMACAIPPLLELPRAGGLRVMGGQSSEPRALFSRHDLLIINGGTQAGLQLGQRFFVRRTVTFGDRLPVRPRAVRTSGWIRIVAVNDSTAIGSVEYGCGDIVTGDYLDPFVAPSVPDGADRIDTTGEPDFGVPARVLFGRDETWLGGTGDFMVIDRGSEQGLRPGARLAIYRDVKAQGVPLTSIGEAIVVATAPLTATVRITLARDSIQTGDMVYPRKP